MIKPAYYNEIDPYAAQWLRNLIKAGLIADGDVDERSIEDVAPSELFKYGQCHFFAGVGVWSYSLRKAGWPDDRPVWTGSCPCQPFSAAGKGAGFSDERHLWPDWFHLISECRPPVIYGEQVASKDAEPWLDLVRDDLEGLAYAFGAVAFPSAGVGAPHIRDRTYWMANAECSRVRRESRSEHCAQTGIGDRQNLHDLVAGGDSGSLGNTERQGLALGKRIARIPRGARGADAGQAAERAGLHAGGMEHAEGCGRAGEPIRAAGRGPEIGAAQGGDLVRPGPTNGLWAAADWVLCRDGRWRPVEPGTFPLAHGAPARVGRLRAYGNAINAEAARVFIESTV